MKLNARDRVFLIEMDRSLVVMASLVAPLAVCHAHQYADDSEPVVETEVGQTIDDWMWRMEQFGVHGALLVVKDGQTILRKGYGVADHASGRSISHETLFDIGSLAKQFTAAAILKLEMQGKLRVEDPITAHLAGVPQDKHAITIHHLLTHTSGLPYHDDGAASSLALPLDSQPGERFAYSNPGYILLADIVEAASGSTFEAFVEREIFAAAGLDRTGFRGRMNQPEDAFAVAYTDDTAQGSARTARPTASLRGAGGVVSCVDDLYKWETAILLGTVLSDAAREKFFTEHVRNDAGTFGYAYGWMTTTTERGTRLCFHQGNYGGFNADYRRYVDEDLTIVFLSNHYMSGRSMRDAVVNHVSRLVNDSHSDLVPQPPHIIDLFPEDSARLIGTYKTESGSEIDVSLADDGRTFLVSGEGQEAINMLFSPWMSDEDRAFVDACNQRAVAVIEGAFHDDPEPFRESVSPALPGAWPDLQQLSRDLELHHGPLVACRALGTALSGGSGHGRTFVDIECADGLARLAFTFAPGGVVHFEQIAAADDYDPRIACPFHAFLSDAICHFDIFAGRKTTITFLDNWEAKIVEMEIETGLGERVIAKRLED